MKLQTFTNNPVGFKQPQRVGVQSNHQAKNNQ